MSGCVGCHFAPSRPNNKVRLKDGIPSTTCKKARDAPEERRRRLVETLSKLHGEHLEARQYWMGGFLVGWGGVLAQAEGCFGLGWVFS